MSVAEQDRGDAGLPCPLCRMELVMSERQGIEIDQCPTCRGVWLSRRELDKIIECSVLREASWAMLPAPGQPAGGWNQRPPPLQPSGGHHSRGQGYGHCRRSWLQDLFE